MSRETMLLSAINVVIFYLLWFWGYRQYFIHSYRHELFVLRDKLFKFAEEDNISFEDPYFRLRWVELNSMIRSVRETRVIFWSVIYLVISKKETSASMKYKQIEAQGRKNLNKRQREFFKQLRNEEIDLFFSYLVKSSFVMMFLSAVATIYLLVKYKMIKSDSFKMRKRVSKKMEPYFNKYTELAIEVK